MAVDLVTRDLPPDITVMALTGRLILGNRLKEVERAIPQRDPSAAGIRIFQEIDRTL